MESQEKPTDASEEPFVITQTKGQILQRMAAGEKLRWVPRSMIGLRSPCKGQRILVLGNDFLDDDSGIEVVILERKGIIVEIEYRDSSIIDYRLA